MKSFIHSLDFQEFQWVTDFSEARQCHSTSPHPRNNKLRLRGAKEANEKKTALTRAAAAGQTTAAAVGRRSFSPKKVGGQDPHIHNMVGVQARPLSKR